MDAPTNERMKEVLVGTYVRTRTNRKNHYWHLLPIGRVMNLEPEKGYYEIAIMLEGKIVNKMHAIKNCVPFLPTKEEQQAYEDAVARSRGEQVDMAGN